MHSSMVYVLWWSRVQHNASHNGDRAYFLYSGKKLVKNATPQKSPKMGAGENLIALNKSTTGGYLSEVDVWGHAFNSLCAFENGCIFVWHGGPKIVDFVVKIGS